MGSPSDFDIELEELRRRSVDRLMTAEVFDLKAFEALRSHLCQKAEEIKHEYVVSKQVLAVLRSVPKAIEAKADYLPEVQQHVALASSFHLLLDQIVGGESCSERVPGTPRVI